MEKNNIELFDSLMKFLGYKREIKENRDSEEIANSIIWNLRENNDIKYWDKLMLFDNLNLLPHEEKLINNVIELLIFYGALIKHNPTLGIFRNNYYDKGINYE